MQNELVAKEADQKAAVKAKLLDFVTKSQSGCSRNLCFREMCKKNPGRNISSDYVPIDQIECFKFAYAEELKLDKFVCSGLPFSGITDKIIEEKLVAEDAQFFSEEYLLFLMNPEEAGAAFQIGQDSSTYAGKINLDLIKRVNGFLVKLPEAVKQTMISKVDNYMVFTINERE